MLAELSNIDLANRMLDLTKRFGELSMWMLESEMQIHQMISGNMQDQARIATELDLKQRAEVEKYIVLSDLKKIELEMDRRVNGK